MCAQSTLSKILFVAALGVSTAAQATDPNQTTFSSMTGSSANASGAQTSSNNTNNTTSTSTFVSTVSLNSAANMSGIEIIHQTPPIVKKGFFTDTVTTSTIFTREEAEYSSSDKPETKVLSTADGILSLDMGGNFAKVNPSLGITQNTNTYLKTSVCEINLFSGVHCESSYRKIDSKPSVSLTNSVSLTPQPVAP